MDDQEQSKGFPTECRLSSTAENLAASGWVAGAKTCKVIGKVDVK